MVGPSRGRTGQWVTLGSHGERHGDVAPDVIGGGVGVHLGVGLGFGFRFGLGVRVRG